MKNKSLLVLVILVILKLSGSIDWPWSVVLIPLWTAIIVVVGNLINLNKKTKGNEAP